MSSAPRTQHTHTPGLAAADAVRDGQVFLRRHQHLALLLTCRGPLPAARRRAGRHPGDLLALLAGSRRVSRVIADRIAARQVGRALQQSLANVRAMAEP